MKKTRLGRTGLEVTPIGFGAAPIGYLDTPLERVERLLSAVLDRGVNVIDTAECYPGSEEAIGQAASHRRRDYVLVTKCGHEPEGIRGVEWSATLIARSVDLSLKRLRTDVLDVVLLHSCDLDTLKRGEALGELVRARQAGKIRWVGYSGDGEAAAYAATLADVAVIETSISICDQDNIDVVLPVAAQRDIGVIAKRPLANAAWRKPSEQQGVYADYASTYSQRLAAMRVTPADLGNPGDPRQAWPELALRFTLAQRGVHTAIIGTTNATHLEDNFAALAKGPLAAAGVARLRAAFRAAETTSGTRWTGET